MPHAQMPIAETDYDVTEVSAGGVVYRVVKGEPVFLVIRDSYRNWGFPKGHLEGDELPEAAAVREVQEETGLSNITIEQKISTVDWRFKSRRKKVRKICHFFLMHTSETATTPQQEEGITACCWLTFDEAHGRMSYRNTKDVLLMALGMVMDDKFTIESRSPEQS